MAKLNAAATNGIEDHASSITMLASLGVLVCMIVSLVGIKIWWFKHRLTFDHNSTTNGVAGGQQPAVVMRQRSSKDKRQSQQYLESVEVHGVFRKRQEDELEFQPPNQLPPVRIRKHSQSTTSLLLPPTRRRHEVQSTAFEELQPPVREPPRPPVESLPTTPTQEEVLTFEEFEKQFKKIEVPALEQAPQQPIVKEEKKVLVPPQPPKRLNRGTSNDAQGSVQKVLKARAALAEAEHKRRLTGFARPTEDFQLGGEERGDKSDSGVFEEFGERRPTGYIKYEDLDMEGLEDFREKWDNMPLGMEAKHYVDYNELGRLKFERDFLQHDDYNEHRKIDFEKDFPQDDYSTSPPNASGGGFTERKPLKYIRSGERMWQNVDLSTNYEDKKNLFSNAHEQMKLEDTSMSQHELNEPPILKITRPESSNENEETFIETTEFQIHHGRDYTPPPHNVKFLVPVTNALDKDTRDQQVRRPTGFIRRDDKFWEDMEKIDNHGEDDEKHVWLEMEKDINNDFASNIEEEFNKIRHSYEANEGDFLEIKDELKKYGYKRENSVGSPKGYGKSIDEDWDSFKNLETTKHNLNSTETKETKPLKHEGEVFNEIPIAHNVSFNFAELEDVNEKQQNSLYTQERRPTAYERNFKCLNHDLDVDEDDDDENDLEQFKHKTKVKFNIEEINDDDSNNEEPSSLKERRPTGFIRRDLSLEDEEAIEHDYKSVEPLVVEPIRKPKPRQKVTFDFNTEEHLYVPADHQHTAYDSESEEPPEIPKPMQRITKIRYTEESPVQVETTPLPSLSTPPILFSTQVSMTDDNTDCGANASDSWSAIRQHRYLTEEFQQFSLTQQEIVPPKEAAPRAAYRNPLAQMSAVRSTEVAETEQELSYVKPSARTMREMKQTKTQSRQYFENYSTSTTEA